MACPLTPFAIAERWSLAFVNDRNIAAWAQEYFGKPLAVQIGADMRRSPEADDAPFIAIFPDGSETGPQRQDVTANIGLIVGITDEDFSANAHGVAVMRGLLRLNELCPLLEKAMREALPKARLQKIATEYEIMQYPLCMIMQTITVEESLPIGRR